MKVYPVEMLVDALKEYRTAGDDPGQLMKAADRLADAAEEVLTENLSAMGPDAADVVEEYFEMEK